MLSTGTPLHLMGSRKPPREVGLLEPWELAGGHAAHPWQGASPTGVRRILKGLSQPLHPPGFLFPRRHPAMSFYFPFSKWSALNPGPRSQNNSNQLHGWKRGLGDSAAQTSLPLKDFPIGNLHQASHTWRPAPHNQSENAQVRAGVRHYSASLFSMIPPPPPPSLSLQPSAMRAHYHQESGWKASLINRTKQACLMGKRGTGLSLAKAFQIHPPLFPQPHPSPPIPC